MSELFQCKDGREVSIHVDEMDYEVIVLDMAGREIGKMEFRFVEDVTEDYLKLAWAYLDKVDPSYCKKGIGRECLRLVAEASGLPIVAADNDGHQQDDGSHLTGDAPGFVERMRAEGLIAPSNE